MDLLISLIQQLLLKRVIPIEFFLLQKKIDIDLQNKIKYT